MRRFLVLAAATVAAAILINGLETRTDSVAAHGAPGRISEPVILTGADLAAFAGATRGELWAYAYEHDSWELLPLQMDERSASGDIVASEDGVLDANDEVVFMSDLVGSERPEGVRPPGIELCHPTAEVRLTDPRAADWAGYVYLFRSLTGPEPAFAPAVAWDPQTGELTSAAYTLAFASADDDGFVGIKTLRLFSGASDLLDRLKIRLTVSALGVELTYTEESDTLTVPDVEAVSTGLVRVVLNEAGTAVAYGRRVRLGGLMDDLFPAVPGITITDLQAALDFLPTAGAGTYLDANAAGPVAIDGVPDAVAAAPWSPWRSVEFLDGRLALLGQAVSPATEAANTFFDGAPFPRDTGDGVTYGQVGVQAGNVDALLQSGFPGDWVFLSPGQEITAETLYSQSVSPLDVTVSHPNEPTPACPTPNVPPTGTPTPTVEATTPVPSPTPTMFDDGPCGDGRADCYLYLPQTRNEKASG